MDCLRGCICGGDQSLQAIIQKRDVKSLAKVTKKIESRGLNEALQAAAFSGNVNCTTATGTRPLHEAVKAGDEKIVVRLLKAKALPDAKDGDDKTAMDVARGRNDKHMLQLLNKAHDNLRTTKFMEGISMLPNVSLFKSLPPAEYPRLAAAFTSKKYEADEVVIRQGEPGSELFIITKGAAQVLVQGPEDQEPVLVNFLKVGDHFGEAALLSEVPRNATIKATMSLEVKVLSRADLQKLDLRSKLHFPQRKAVLQGDDVYEDPMRADLVKTDAQREMLKEAIRENAYLGPLLQQVDASGLDSIVEKAFKVEVEAGLEVMTQGSFKADLFYVVEGGQLEVRKDGKRVCEYGPGDSFGELALLFRAPRAATVLALAASRLWALPRQDLRLLMQAQTKSKVEGRATLLGSLDCMKRVTLQDKARLADALVEATFSEGEYIIRQGEEGQTFFILYEGEVSVEVNGGEVTRYFGDPAAGTFETFGERALETDEARAASVKALSKRVVVLALDRSVYMTIRGMDLKTDSLANQDMIDYQRNQLQTIGLLGCGGFGVVTLVKCKLTGNTFALKALSKGHLMSNKQEGSVMTEKAILRMTFSPFLIRLGATFNSASHLYFLLEPAMGGELFTVYQRKGFYGSAEHARFYVACVVQAFEHLHQRSIVYRDLKPENCLLDAAGYCKVTDFGLAKFSIGHSYTTCGTPDYFAPEMIKGVGHTNAVDWWTLGVFTYELMMSEPPFSAPGTMSIFRNVQRGIEQAKFPAAKSWPSLVKGLCKKEPSERIPVRKGCTRAIKEHRWFADESFNWAALAARTMKVPYRPAVKSGEDMSNFMALAEDAPRDIPYTDPGTGWDRAFEDTRGPARFD